MTEVEFASSLVAMVLAIVAIVLSLKFFALSEESAKNIRETTADIENSVLRLEAIFDRLYRDTFGLVKEAMGDLRTRVRLGASAGGPRVTAEIEERTVAKIDEVREEMDARLTTELKKDQPGPVLERELAAVLETTIERTRDATAQARYEAFEDEFERIYREAVASGHELTAGEVTSTLVPIFGVREVADGLLDLRRLGRIRWTAELTPESHLVMD
jgi:hypothetical protein